jgi:hypothetical protein
MAHASGSVTGLTQHISRLDPDKDAARLSFYNYLKNLCDPTREVNSELVNAFYTRALSFSHWQESKADLFREVEALLNHFQHASGNALNLSDIIRANDLQVVRAENLSQVEPVVKKWISARVAPNEKYRILRDADSRLVAIILKQDHSLSVTTFDASLALRNGELTPLNNDLSVHYDSNLQLHPQMIQNIEAGSHSIARFHVGIEGLRGVFVRGYTFQKSASLDGGGLGRYPMLFYPLKRLEQYFVDRATDRTYSELTNGLEKAIDLLSDDSATGAPVAQSALERGRLALEQIYPDDRMLRLLITNLEKSLALLASANARPTLRERIQSHSDSVSAPEPEGTDLLAEYDSPSSAPKDEPWPEIRNLPV